MSMTPAQAQAAARSALRFAGIDVPDDHTVVLTDLDHVGPRFAINPGQVVAAAEQYHLGTGETIDAGALVTALPWSGEEHA